MEISFLQFQYLVSIQSHSKAVIENCKWCSYYLGIPVAEIAKDGQYSIEENIRYTKGLGPEDLNTFTNCLRFNVNFLRAEATLLAYSSFLHDNTYDVWYYNKVLEFCRYYGIHKGIKTVCNQVTLKTEKIHDQWHHACWSFKTSGIGLDQIKVSTNLYYGGQEVMQGNKPSQGEFQ